jgi:ABC-type glycerol-3-phosphate transport system permease component
MSREARSQGIAGGAPYGALRNWLAGFGKYLVLLLFAALSLYPLLLIISTSLKDPLDVTADPFALFSSFNPVNFYDAWTLGGFGGYFWNTVVITAITVVSVVALSSLAGYALARFRFPGSNIIFFIFILGLMIPFFSVMIPLFYELKSLSLLGTKAAVILPAIAGAHGFGLPLGVFLMRSFYMDLPEELADAARVEGANEFQVFRRIMLPLSAPGVAVLAVLVFFQTWNNFLLPLVYLQGSENQMLASGLYLFAGGRTGEYELGAAGSLIMVVPVVILFLIFQRYFIRGLTAGAFK